jgi:hypothetical protein
VPAKRPADAGAGVRALHKHGWLMVDRDRHEFTPLRSASGVAEFEAWSLRWRERRSENRKPVGD